MTLPYTVQDVYDRAQTPTDVPVLLLQNNELEATITPQWGGQCAPHVHLVLCSVAAAALLEPPQAGPASGV